MKEKKEKKLNKFIEVLKKKWLIDGTKTTLLVLAIILLFIGINILMQKLELTPIDFSQEKLYTLTQESKDKVKNIDKDVHIYFVGSTDEDSNLELAKQYKKANEKIVAEAVNVNDRPDLVQKYGIENGVQGIIVECGDNSKVLTANDLVTYDTTTYETISIAEEKLTSSILTVTSNEIPKVYFLEGYSEYKLSTNMRYLSMFLANEVNEIETLNILSTGKVPEDCKVLVITTPNKDFDETATNAIKDYINAGGNILWLNGVIAEKQDLPNVNSVLELYGVNPFDVGMIFETDSSKTVSGMPYVIFPTIGYSNLTKTLYNTSDVLLIYIINCFRLPISSKSVYDIESAAIISSSAPSSRPVISFTASFTASLTAVTAMPSLEMLLSISVPGASVFATESVPAISSPGCCAILLLSGCLFTVSACMVSAGCCALSLTWLSAFTVSVLVFPAPVLLLVFRKLSNDCAPFNLPFVLLPFGTAGYTWLPSVTALTSFINPPP